MGRKKKDDLNGRAVQFGYLILNGLTYRDIGKKYHLSKSTIFYDIQNRLKFYKPDLHSKVQKKLDNNFKNKHLQNKPSMKEEGK